MADGDGYSSDAWRDCFPDREAVSDEEIRVLDELGAGPWEDHSAEQMLEAYRLGRAHERQASAPST